jgi:hypothetical protein
MEAWSHLWAEGDLVLCHRATYEPAIVVVIAIADCVRAETLEEARVVRRWARSRSIFWWRATVVRSIELDTWAHTAPVHLQLRRTLCVDVGGASDGVAATAAGGQAHRHVKTIFEGDVVEVPDDASTEVQLGECRWRLPGSFAG